MATRWQSNPPTLPATHQQIRRATKMSNITNLYQHAVHSTGVKDWLRSMFQRLSQPSYHEVDHGSYYAIEAQRWTDL